jgi:magnesium transporter
MAQKTLLTDTLRTLAEAKRFQSIKDVILTMNPFDLAVLFNGLDEKTVTVLFRLLPRDMAGDVFSELDRDTQETLIRAFTDSELKLILNDLFTDDAADLVEEMPANVASRILAQADSTLRNDINQILKYPEDSAGSVMTTEFVKLRENMTIGQALEHIRNVGLEKETVYTCYVTKNGKLLGTVAAKALLVARDMEKGIKEIMEDNFVSVLTTTDREEVSLLFKKYNLIALPVVDGDNRLAGIITFDDVMDVMEQETTEDITIMSGQTPYEKPYKNTSALSLYLHRIPWLLILMVSATFTGMIISHFEAALAAQVVLTAFIPMLMDTGGNSGSQSSVTIIRAISLGELGFKDLPRVILKELLTALFCGLTLAAVCFGKVMLVDGLMFGNASVTVYVALVVSCTILLTVMVAKIVGCSLPIIAKKLGFDPAVMASPFITTAVDAISLLIYFGIASIMLF